MIIALLRYAAALAALGAVLSAEAQLITTALKPEPREIFRCFETWPRGADSWCPLARNA